MAFNSAVTLRKLPRAATDELVVSMHKYKFEKNIVGEHPCDMLLEALYVVSHISSERVPF